jgi:hypothetical protein
MNVALSAMLYRTGMGDMLRLYQQFQAKLWALDPSTRLASNLPANAENGL